MKKLSKKKSLLVVLLVTTAVLTVYGVSVVYSVTNISYQTGETVINPTIALTGFPPDYTGYITLLTPLTLENNGLYTIKGLEINIRVTSNDWEISSFLNGVEIVSGSNAIGTISAGESWHGNIDVNITNFIPNFALEDCTLLIEVIINLTYQPLIDIPLSFTIEQSEPYLAPF